MKKITRKIEKRNTMRINKKLRKGERKIEEKWQRITNRAILTHKEKENGEIDRIIKKLERIKEETKKVKKTYRKQRK